MSAYYQKNNIAYYKWSDSACKGRDNYIIKQKSEENKQNKKENKSDNNVKYKFNKRKWI